MILEKRKNKATRQLHSHIQGHDHIQNKKVHMTRVHMREIHHQFELGAKSEQLNILRPQHKLDFPANIQEER